MYSLRYSLNEIYPDYLCIKYQLSIFHIFLVVYFEHHPRFGATSREWVICFLTFVSPHLFLQKSLLVSKRRIRKDYA